MKLYNDHFQNHRRYQTPRAQLIIADIPYNTGTNAYGSNPQWYVDGDSAKGTSEVAGKQFFDTDKDFRIHEFMHFASRMLKREPKQRGQAGCMVVFCAFDQQMELIEAAKKYGFMKYINLVFRKNFGPQVLKANMRIVGNAEYGLVLYRDKLPMSVVQGILEELQLRKQITVEQRSELAGYLHNRKKHLPEVIERSLRPRDASTKEKGRLF